MRDHRATFDTPLDECYTYPTKQEEKRTMEKLVYLSPEWAEEAARRLRQDLTPERMKYLTSSMLTVYTNCPDGRKLAVYYRVEDGIVQEVALQEGEPSRAEFTITGNYETFARISRAELKARSALMSGKLTLKGNLVKALRLAPVVDRLNEVLATIPTDY
jgi:putative sterol carrier protein